MTQVIDADCPQDQEGSDDSNRVTHTLLTVLSLLQAKELCCPANLPFIYISVVFTEGEKAPHFGRFHW